MLETERAIFTDHLRAQGLRVTPERLAVFDEIFHHHQHFDADQLLALLRKKRRKVSRATVYRTLELLVGSGLVSRVKLGGEEYRYEHVHPGEHHDHIVCLHCGKIYEFESDEIEKLQEEICRRFGFHPRAHSHKIEGCCADCWAKPPGAKGKGGPAAKRAGR